MFDLRFKMTTKIGLAKEKYYFNLFETIENTKVFVLEIKEYICTYTLYCPRIDFMRMNLCIIRITDTYDF